MLCLCLEDGCLWCCDISLAISCSGHRLRHLKLGETKHAMRDFGDIELELIQF